ncbi:hypothetical protein CCR97_16135 [Rhodoplanes elegans]|uniref:Uncharacterized protein n=1 Tax=Rhodoplanes elegans TaxID=29408 RepID=A0A327K571_9BRAD|nr:hypothetical protein [Rhodoplanes elegans]MBK5959722.1 hypothetical protein [Rhodoplanes elegans]RAI33511.1 hypothetical protein CH338_22430 [Rhodoplanes elegans]
MVASVSSSSSYPYPTSSSRSRTAAVDPAERFEAAVEADAASATSTVARSSAASTRSAVTPESPAVVTSRADGTVAYRIDPSRVHRLAPPTREGVATLAADVADRLDAAFEKAGLPTTPPVSIAVDETGVHVSGERDDLAAVEDLLASDVDLRRSIKIAHSITAQAYALEHTRPEDSYRNAGNPLAAIDSFIKMMEAQRAVAMQLVYDGGAVSVTANGTAWPPVSEPAAGSEPSSAQAA